MPLIVHLSCGCVRTPKEMILSKNYKRGHNLVCPEHPEATREKIIFRCENCGDETDKNNSGKLIKNLSGVKRFCIKCYKARNAALSKKAYCYPTRDYKRVSYRDNDPTQNKWDCIHYNECLMKVCRDKNCRTLPCKGCERYQSQEMSIMDFVSYGETESYESNFTNMKWAR